MSGRLVGVASGVAALAALLAMIALVIVGVDDGETGSASGGAGPFPAGALTVGIEDDQLAIVSPELVPGRVERLAATGARFTRVEVAWAEIGANRPAAPADPSDPAYRWARYDAILDGLAAQGIEAIAAVSRAPGWANGGNGPEAAPDADAYAGFVRALATRYDGRVHARLRLYEPWDEPNNPLKLMPQWDGVTARSPALYAEMLGRAYAEIKAAQPDALVIGVSAAHVETSAPPAGGVAVVDFLQGLSSRRPPMDAVAVHLAPGAAPNAPSEAVPSFATLDRLIAEIDRVAPDAPVLVTRFGYATSAGGVSENDQGAYLTQALERLAGTPRVRFASWFALQDGPARPAGLLRSDGSEKPAWRVFAAGPKVLPSGAGP